MDRMVPVVTAESLQEEEVDKRIWHAGYPSDETALCGVKGKWVGAGLIVTCKDCLKLMKE